MLFNAHYLGKYKVDVKDFLINSEDNEYEH